MRFDDTGSVQASFRRELQLGRLVMIAFIAIFLFRELWSVEVESSSVRVIVMLGSAVFALTWGWFWAVVAASSNRIAAGVAVSLMVGSAALLVGANHIGVFPFYFAVVVAGAAFRWQLGVVLVSAVVVVTLAVWWPQGQTNATALQVFGITALLGGAAITVRRFIEAQVELDASREELLGFAALQARMDLARDLHDRLGQQLVASIMQAELLAMDLEAGDVAEARDRSGAVLSSSRDSLDLMRSMVSGIREPDVQSEVALAERVLISSGIRCTVAMEDERLPADADRVLGWVVREGVTNVLRHSGAASCRIEVQANQEAVTLRIEDDGCGVSPGGEGMGLTHMRERLAEVGGSMSLSDEPEGGCVLAAKVPLSS